MISAAQKKELVDYLRYLRLPGIREIFEESVEKAIQEGMGYPDYLAFLLEHEYDLRRNNRIARFLKDSRLPLDKTRESFDMKRLPFSAQQKMQTLFTGEFMKRCENVLLFGQPGTGKTHLLCAIAREQIRAGKRVLFMSSAFLVQRLLAAKKALRLEKLLKSFSKYEALIIDDIGYVQHNRDEMEVLFTLIAERYERGSIMLSSNLPFSKWETIFKDPMTAAAAIDRLVHHSIIVELNLKSYRTEAALKRKGDKGT